MAGQLLPQMPDSMHLYAHPLIRPVPMPCRQLCFSTMFCVKGVMPFFTNIGTVFMRYVVLTAQTDPDTPLRKFNNPHTHRHYSK
jgi:hypothetical protein